MSKKNGGVRCRFCGRPLKNPASIVRLAGDQCAAKHGIQISVTGRVRTTPDKSYYNTEQLELFTIQNRIGRVDGTTKV